MAANPVTDSQRIAELEKKSELLTRRLDEALRVCGLPPVMDAQLLAINSRHPLANATNKNTKGGWPALPPGGNAA